MVPITAFLIGVGHGSHFVAAALIGATLVVRALLTNGLALNFSMSADSRRA